MADMSPPPDEVGTPAPESSTLEQPSRTGPEEVLSNADEVTARLVRPLFVGMVLFGCGLFDVTQGLLGLADENLCLLSHWDWMFDVACREWGWALTLLGSGLMAAGLGMLLDCFWAQVTAIVGVVADALLNVGFLTTFPAWAAVTLSGHVLAIWALAVPVVEPRSSPAEGRRRARIDLPRRDEYAAPGRRVVMVVRAGIRVRSGRPPGTAHPAGVTWRATHPSDRDTESEPTSSWGLS
jgi:hypothetical protein